MKKMGCRGEAAMKGQAVQGNLCKIGETHAERDHKRLAPPLTPSGDSTGLSIKKSEWGRNRVIGSILPHCRLTP